jgi:hypothetical protein
MVGYANENENEKNTSKIAADFHETEERESEREEKMKTTSCYRA